MKNRRYMSLLEIMMVLSLIVMIAGVVGFNMKGSLEKGKAFKTKQAIHRIYDIIHMRQEETGETYQYIIDNIDTVLAQSGLVKKPADLLKDGWNKDFVFSLTPNGDDVRIHSDKIIDYATKQGLNQNDLYPW